MTIPSNPLPQAADYLHLRRPDWLLTPKNDKRGYIQPQNLRELWFHTGTICNLSCPFCLEGSKPGDDRLNKITLEDAKPFIEEALELGVERFSFTGGEPFVIKDMVRILDYALDFRPCMVLTNATRPLSIRLEEIKAFSGKGQQLSFRVSLDYPDARRHDEARGAGNFALALETLAKLYAMGFAVSLARQREKGENTARADGAYRRFFKAAGLPEDIRIVSFPDFLLPGDSSSVPHITEKCMDDYHDDESRAKFMCNFSKMVVKKDGKMRVYACTLVDDDEDYDLGATLKIAMRARVMMKHHRCYSCFAQGASCSEI